MQFFQERREKEAEQALASGWLALYACFSNRVITNYDSAKDSGPVNKLVCQQDF